MMRFLYQTLILKLSNILTDLVSWYDLLPIHVLSPVRSSTLQSFYKNILAKYVLIIFPFFLSMSLLKLLYSFT